MDTLLIRQIKNRDFTVSHKFTPGGVFQEGARWAACFFLTKKNQLNIFHIKKTDSHWNILRIQVRANSQTKGLERGWKKRARLWASRARHALLISLLFLRKKPTVLQSKNRCDVKFNLKPIYWVIIQYPQTIYLEKDVTSTFGDFR